MVGKICGLVEDVLVELDFNVGMLVLVIVLLVDVLGVGLFEVFIFNGIFVDVIVDLVMECLGDCSFFNDDGLIIGSEFGIEGGIMVVLGINGFCVWLFYNLDLVCILVLGSW